jgi:xanthine dehydrogenase accessory factor
VVVATQGVWDEEALAAALSRNAAYVGLVASPTRAAVVRAWLRDEAHVPEERLAALRAPAGLDLGAETAEEVALSILAELVQVRRGTAAFVASPGPATLAGETGPAPALEPVVDDIVLLDPVCGMTVDRAHARHLAEHDGIVYAFCSMGCRTSFIREPTAYLTPSVSPPG